MLWKSDYPVLITQVSGSILTYLLLFNSLQIGLVRFLKHIVSLIKCFRLKISQKAETVASVGSALRSPINLKLSYLDDNRSKCFCHVCSNVLILMTFWGYMCSRGPAFILILISAKNPSIVILVIGFKGISSRIYRSIPPPLPFLSHLGSEKPRIWNCPVGKYISSFVSEIMRMPILLFTISSNDLKLLIIEFMLYSKYVIIYAIL